MLKTEFRPFSALIGFLSYRMCCLLTLAGSSLVLTAKIAPCEALQGSKKGVTLHKSENIELLRTQLQNRIGHSI